MIRTKTLEPKIMLKIDALNKRVEAGQLERLVHSLYHIKEIQGASDGSKVIPSELNYFAIKTGQNDDNGKPTTYADTNMDTPSAISQGYYFWGQNIRFVALPSKDDETPFVKSIDKNALEKFFINDVGKILADGVVNIEVADKPLVRIAPIMSFPSGIGVVSSTVVGDGSFSGSIIQLGNLDIQSVRPIDLWLENNITFKFKVSFPTPKKVYNTFRLGVYIDGILYRPRA